VQAETVLGQPSRVSLFVSFYTMKYSNLILVFFSLTISIVMFEIFLRVLGINYSIYLKPDLYLGHSLRSNTSTINNDEHRAFISINSFGYRDKEWTGNEKIAFIGDSFTEARQVEAEERFTELPCGTMNFGVSGFGTAQEYIVLQRDVLWWEPEVVVLVFFPGNDFINNEERDHRIPYYDNGWDFSFRDDKKFQSLVNNEWIVWMINRSSILQLLNRMKGIVVSKVYAKTVTEDLILKIRDASPRFILLVIPEKDSDGTSEAYLSDFAKENNIEYIIPDLVDSDYYDHLSVEGHKKVRSLLETICE